MTNAQADRASYYYVQETAWGTTPTAPTLALLRLTSEDLAFEPTTTESAELDAGGEVTDLILVNQRAAGSINAEFSYQSFDNQLANLLRTHSGSSVGWASAVTINGTTISAAASDNSLNDSGSGFISGGLSATTDVGKWVKISGFTGVTANNTWGKIVSVAAGKIVLSNCTLADDAAGESVTIVRGGYIENGTTLGSETVVRLYNDLGTTPNIPAASFTGMSPDTFTLNIQAGAVATCTFGYVGKAETDCLDSTVASGSETYSASPGAGKTPFNCTSNVQTIYVGGNSYPVRSLTLNVNNGIRAREQVGTLGAASLGLGKCRVTVDFEAYYAGNTEYAKFLAQTDSAAWWVMQDIDGNQYLIEVPLMKWSTFRRTNPGTGQDFTAASTGTCIADATATGGKTIRMTKFAA